MRFDEQIFPLHTSAKRKTETVTGLNQCCTFIGRFSSSDIMAAGKGLSK